MSTCSETLQHDQKIRDGVCKYLAQYFHRLQLQLCPPPVSPLGIVPDGVASPHPDPLGDGPVLLPLLGQLALDAESLQGRHDY